MTDSESFGDDRDADDLDYDYEEMISTFVANGLNIFELTVGETDDPDASIWLDGIGGGYYSSNESVVTVNKYGKVTAVGEGSTYVVIVSPVGTLYEVYKYKVFGEVPEADLSHLPEIEGIDFAEEIEQFKETPLNTKELKLEQADSPTASVWASSGGSCYTSDENVVTVDKNGTVCAVGEGTAYVIIKSAFGDMFSIYKYMVKA